MGGGYARHMEAIPIPQPASERWDNAFQFNELHTMSRKRGHWNMEGYFSFLSNLKSVGLMSCEFVSMSRPERSYISSALTACQGCLSFIALQIKDSRGSFKLEHLQLICQPSCESWFLFSGIWNLFFCCENFSHRKTRHQWLTSQRGGKSLVLSNIKWPLKLPGHS